MNFSCWRIWPYRPCDSICLDDRIANNRCFVSHEFPYDDWDSLSLSLLHFSKPHRCTHETMRVSTIRTMYLLISDELWAISAMKSLPANNFLQKHFLKMKLTYDDDTIVIHRTAIRPIGSS